MARAYFLHQIKHNPNGAWDKGIVVKSAKETDNENYADALQGYHAYLGAYAYAHDPNTDYVSVAVTDEFGTRRISEVWDARPHEDEDGGEEP